MICVRHNTRRKNMNGAATAPNNTFQFVANSVIGNGMVRAEYDPKDYFSVSTLSSANDFSSLASFMHANRSGKTYHDGTVARSGYMENENPDVVENMPIIVAGLAVPEISPIINAIAPVQYTSITTMKWTKVKFAPGGLTRNPHYGTNRATERIVKDFEENAMRYGQHFNVEDGTYRGSKGNQEVMFGMMRFARSIAEWTNFIAWAAMTAPDPESTLVARQEITDEHTLRAFQRTERNDFAMAYKSARGWFVAFQKYNAIAKDRCTLEVTDFVIPRSKKALVTSGTDLSEYARGGEPGIKALRSTGKLLSIDGVTIHESPSFVLNPKLNNVSPLDTQRRVGSYHEFKFEIQGDHVYGVDSVYDVNSDRWIPMSKIFDMLRCSGRFETIAVDIVHTTELRSKSTFPPTDSWSKMKMSGKTKSAGEWVRWIIENQRIFGFAPFDGYNMQGEMYASAGGGSPIGITCVTPPNIAHGVDATTKNHVFNLTLDFGSYIFDRSRILHRRDAYYNGIIGGGNTELITPNAAERLKNDGFRDGSRNRESIYVLIVDKNAPIDPFAIHINGRHPIMSSNSKATYPDFEFYSDLYGWSDVDESAGGTESFIATTLFKREFNRASLTNHKYQYTPGETHHGPIVGVGSQIMRDEGTHIPERIITDAGVMNPEEVKTPIGPER